MKILVLGMNYAPELTGIGPYTTDLTEYLQSMGFAVTVITAFPHYPQWVIERKYRGKLFRNECIDSVNVFRTWVYLPAKGSAIGRILYDTSFAVLAFVRGLFTPRTDAILVISPPLQAAFFGYILSKLKGARFILQIQDLAVDAAVSLGFLKWKFLIQMVQSFEQWVYQRADHVFVICRGFSNRLLSKGLDAGKIVIAPNWVDTEFIAPGDDGSAFRKAHKVDANAFVVMHAGNIGAKQALDTVLLAARTLIKHPEILFIIVGDGAYKDALIDFCKQHSLTNVRFLPLQPRQVLPQMLSSASVLLVSQRKDVIDTVLPSKLMTYMAAGKPVIAAAHFRSETAEIVREAQCGLVVAPEDPRELVDSIRYMQTNRGHAAVLARNGRHYAERRLSSQSILSKYIEILNS